MKYRRILGIVLALALALTVDAETVKAQQALDLDNDGYPAYDDCDDTDLGIRPLHPDYPDGRDNNCDGVVDGYAPGFPLVDQDRDNYSPDFTAGNGLAGRTVDCDDTNAFIGPYSSSPPHFPSVSCLQSMNFDILENGGFEDHGPTQPGNNVDYEIAPWSVVGGDNRYSVISVSGVPDNFLGSPDSDATGGAGHFFQLGRGAGSNYATGEYAAQTFTVGCTGQYSFGASFNARNKQKSWGGTTIRRQGGNSVAHSSTATIQSTMTPESSPWKTVSGTATLSASETYVFWLRMTTHAIVDEAHVTLQSCQ